MATATGDSGVSLTWNAVHRTMRKADLIQPIMVLGGEILDQLRDEFNL